MAVSREVSAAVMREELELMKDLAQTYGWEVTPNYEQLLVTVVMYSHAKDDGSKDKFIVEALCDDYKELPPLFEFIEPDTGVRGVPNAYPKGKDSLFHTSGPCVCAPFNRKAYKKLFDTGPHPEWELGNWMTSTANNYNWANHTKLGDMFGLIQMRIIRPDHYVGRMV